MASADVHVGDVEDALVRDTDLVAEEAERVDVEDPVRATREVAVEAQPAEQLFDAAGVAVQHRVLKIWRKKSVTIAR